MLSRVIAKNVGDVFLRHSVYSAYDNVFTWLRDEATKALAKTIINKKTYRSQ